MAAGTLEKRDLGHEVMVVDCDYPRFTSAFALAIMLWRF